MIDSIAFRQSFATIMFSEQPGLDSLKSTGATIASHGNSSIEWNLSSLGIIDKDTLVPGNFNPFSDTILKNDKGDVVKLSAYSMIKDRRYIIQLSEKRRIDSIVLDHLFSPEITIAYKELIPGGFPELVVCQKEYVMNGNNYFLKIYTIR